LDKENDENGKGFLNDMNKILLGGFNPPEKHSPKGGITKKHCLRA
jgi:hypothetical protein